MSRELDLYAERRLVPDPAVTSSELFADLIRASEVSNDDGRFLDADALLTRPAILRRIGSRMSQLIPTGVDRLATMHDLSIALTTAVGLELGLSFVAVARSGEVAGVHYRGERIALLLDVTLSGSTGLAAVEALRSRGLDVVTVLSVVDRGGAAAGEFMRSGTPFAALFSWPSVGGAR